MLEVYENGMKLQQVPPYLEVEEYGRFFLMLDIRRVASTISSLVSGKLFSDASATHQIEGRFRWSIAEQNGSHHEVGLSQTFFQLSARGSDCSLERTERN